MKRIFILFGALAIAFGAQAQQNQHSNYIGYYVGGGLNTLMYNPTHGNYSMGLGFNGGPRYTHFFGRHFGIGFGVEFGYNQASTTYDFTEVSIGMTHADNQNVLYDLSTTFNNWNEHQHLMVLSVPVELFWRAPMGENTAFILGLGASLDMPLKVRYSATEGSYSTTGYFPALGYSVSDLPDHGFRSYDADFESDLKINKLGISVLADLGFRFALGRHWGLYLGVYGSYGLTNLLDSVSTSPVLAISEADASQLDYKGTLASNEIDALRLLNVGLKLGIDFGWNCEPRQHDDEAEAARLKAYEAEAARRAEAEREAAAREAAERAAREAAATEEAARQAQAAAAQAEAEAARQAEAAAREASCMTRADMVQAVAAIDNDLETAANAANNNESNQALADARAKAAAAKDAYTHGRACEAYDLYKEAYARMAACYAAAAQTFVTKGDEARKAAQDAATYAAAAARNDLDGAMAANRNARINYELARRAGENATKIEAPKMPENAPAKPVDRVEMQKQLDDINATVYFEFSGTDPHFDAKTDATIRTLCASMMADPTLKVTITGHTDNVGSAASNMKYGMRRAEALKKLMVKLGAPAENIKCESHGMNDPIVPNDTDEHRQQNRRATVVLN